MDEAKRVFRAAIRSTLDLSVQPPQRRLEIVGVPRELEQDHLAAFPLPRSAARGVQAGGAFDVVATEALGHLQRAVCAIEERLRHELGVDRAALALEDLARLRDLAHAPAHVELAVQVRAAKEDAHPDDSIAC